MAPANVPQFRGGLTDQQKEAKIGLYIKYKVGQHRIEVQKFLRLFSPEFNTT